MMISIADNRICIKAPYALKDQLRALPGARWNKEDQAWTYPASPHMAQQIVARFSGVINQTDNAFNALISQQLRINDLAKARLLPPIPKTVLPPWSNQLKGFWLTQHLPGVMLAFDTGTGKTKTTIDVIINDDSLRTILIVCPKSVIDVWPVELRKHVPVNEIHHYNILYQLIF